MRFGIVLCTQGQGIGDLGHLLAHRNLARQVQTRRGGVAYANAILDYITFFPPRQGPWRFFQPKGAGTIGVA
jgi:hypothetical protein